MHVGIEQLLDVKRELGRFGEWRNLGLNLRLSPSLLGVIEKDYWQASERLDAVLSQWLKWNYDSKKFGAPSWGRLADAVKPIDHALAIAIRDRHVKS